MKEVIKMKVKEKFQSKFAGILKAINRYPLTMLLLLAAATISAMLIQQEIERYFQYLVTFLIGALLTIVAQQIYERFFTKTSQRLMLMAGALVLTGAYFFAIYPDSTFDLETSIKTGIAVFALLMAFIWVPSIENKLTFNESFMATFKAFFITALFTWIIAGGSSLIIFAVDRLLFNVGDNTTLHTLNIIFTLFAPIFFLSFTPEYFGNKDKLLEDDRVALREETIGRSISCPNYLNILISYIIIPITGLYTVILLAYILLNIGGDFWTQNLLEPMLVAYSITVIIVYILASHLDNKFANIFRKVFPKVLIPIVLFQTIASILKIGEVGITYGRYYVILFGVFALIAALIFSFMSVRKNGLIVAVLLIFSVISIIPPIDAFTVSRVNQISLLKDTLEENNMLKNDEIIPNSSIPKEDMKKIVRTVRYLEDMNYAKEIKWLPNNLYSSEKFENTFGFSKDYMQMEIDGEFVQSKSVYLNWDNSRVFNVTDYEHMMYMSIHSKKENNELDEGIIIEEDGNTFTVLKKYDDDNVGSIEIIDENDEVLIKVDTKPFFEKILKMSGPEDLSLEDATFTQENDKIKLSMLANSGDWYEDQYNAEIYLFVSIK